MRVSSRAIIIRDGKLLTMFRHKEKNNMIHEYYVIPGGGLEYGETLEENVVRELNEEMGVDIKILGYLGCSIDENNEQHYFHCEIVNGEPKLGGEELDRMSNENYYEPMFISLDDLNSIDIFGLEFVEKAKNKNYTDLVQQK